MVRKKLPFRAKRALKAFPSTGSHSTADLVKLYNQTHGLPWLVKKLGVTKLLNLPMTENRMERILFCLLVRGFVVEETMFEEKLYKLTGAGERNK